MTPYDRWLEKPYHREENACPDCEEGILVDDGDGGVECVGADDGNGGCGYSNGPDWDAIAEARAEARAEGCW